MTKPRLYVLLLIPLLLVASELRAQIPQIGGATDYVSWEARSEPQRVRPGNTFHVLFETTIADPWKMYALDASLPSSEDILARPFGVTFTWNELPEDLSFTGSTLQSRPEEGYDENFDLDLKYFHEGAVFAAEFEAAEDAPDGPRTVEAGIQYQICNDDLGVCLNRVVVPVRLTFEIDAGCEGSPCRADSEAMSSLVAPSFSSAIDDNETLLRNSATDLASYRSRGFWAFLLLAVGAGLASLLTPCVFPMIPLTVSYFTKHADDRPAAVRMASAFGGSIVVTFTGIGVIAAILVGAAGAQRIAANPWVNLFIAVVLVGFALALLGLYELRVPSSVVNWFNRRGAEGSGIVGVLFMGLTLTLVSFSCTAPFVGGLLAAASGGTWAYPLVGMIVYSTTFALPFVLLALFPNALSALPASGAWMNVVKVTLGFIELAAAVKFISNADLIWGWGIVSRPLGIAFVVVVFLMAGFYLVGRIRLAHEPPVEGIGVGRLLGAMLFFIAALYMIPGLLGAPLNRLDAYLPPRQGTDVSILSLFQTSDGRASTSVDDGWIVDDVDQAFEEARQRDLPVFVDFSGYTCTNCREMETNVFPRPAVAERLSTRFVLLRLYTDGLDKGEELSRYQLQLTGTVALPTYAIVDPDGQEVLARWSGMMKESDFTAFLDTGVAVYNRAAAR